MVDFKRGFDYFNCQTMVTDGVPVHVKTLPACPRIQIRIRFCVGARHDPAGKEGLAHHYEHMPLSGCKGWKTESLVNEFSARVLMGSLNASTDFESVCFEAAVLPKNLAVALDFFRSLAFFPHLETKECLKQNRVIMEEFWDHLGSKKEADLVSRWSRMLYGSHPGARTNHVIGTYRSIPCIGPDDLHGFRKDYFHAGNLSMVFAGAVTPGMLDPLIRRFLKDLPFAEKIPLPAVPAEWPSPECGMDRVSVQKYLGQTDHESAPQESSVAADRIIPKSENAEISGMAGCMLEDLWHQALRVDHGHAYSVAVDTDHYFDHSVFSMDTSVPPRHADYAVESLFKAIDQIAKGKKGSLFARTKAAKHEYFESMELASDEVADAMLSHLARWGRVVPVSEMRRSLDALSYGEVCEFVRRELVREKMLITIREP